MPRNLSFNFLVDDWIVYFVGFGNLGISGEGSEMRIGVCLSFVEYISNRVRSRADMPQF